MNISIISRNPVMGVIESISHSLQSLLESFLFAAPKNHRSKRVVRLRHAVQNRQFLTRNQINVCKCPYCGSLKKQEEMCLFCFRFLREKTRGL